MLMLLWLKKNIKSSAITSIQKNGFEDKRDASTGDAALHHIVYKPIGLPGGEKKFIGKMTPNEQDFALTARTRYGEIYRTFAEHKMCRPPSEHADLPK